MATSSLQKPLMGFHGVFYLPVVSLALLTGFTFSFALRAALALFFSAMESAAFISFRHLSNYFLGWPCLFVLMNGIIVVLTATSGMFASPVSEEEDAFEAYKPKLQSLRAFKGDTLLEMSRGYGEWKVPDADRMGKTEETGSLPIEDDEGKGKKEEEEDGCVQTEHEDRLKEEEEEEEEYYELHDAEEEEPENGTRLLRESLASKSFSIAESRVLRGVGGHHDHVMDPFLRSNSMKRSFSIDSAPYYDNQPIPSIEELSDEAFKNRVEDFISRMNAKLRNEMRK